MVKLLVPIICTILVCLTAGYIWNDYKKQHAYEYVTTRIGDGERISKINRTDQSVEFLKYTDPTTASWVPLGE